MSADIIPLTVAHRDAGNGPVRLRLAPEDHTTLRRLAKTYWGGDIERAATELLAHQLRSCRQTHRQRTKEDKTS